MALTDEWVLAHYNELVEKYAGLWVLIQEDRVVFSDRRFDVVYERSKNLCTNNDDCVIRRIDSGDAAFYGIKISLKEDYP